MSDKADAAGRSDRTSRRKFTGGLLASGVAGGWLGAVGDAVALPQRARIESLDDVLNIAHLDQAASRRLSAEAYHFIVGASDDGLTKQANRLAYQQTKIRPRRLVDVSTLDTGVELFGRLYSSPIILAPAGNQQQVHAEGELATARAAARKGHLMVVGQMSNFSIEEVAATGVASWFQLYPSANREFMLHLAARAQAAGCGALVLTIDGPSRGNHEAARWFRSHPVKGQAKTTGAPGKLGNFEDFAGPKGIGDPALDWEAVAALRKQLELPLVLKGIVTREDARLCRKHGIDGVVVSNHGGRQEGNGRATLDVLPEVVDELGGRMPVLVDGGIRRGSDVFKALAYGADAVCIGRPYLWGLGAFGQPGVEKCLRILSAEFERTLRYAGTPSLADISPQHVWRD